LIPGNSAFLVVLAVLVMHHFSLIQWPTSLYLTVSGHTPRMAALEREMEQKKESERQARAAARAAIPPPAHEPLFAAVDEGSLVGLETALAASVDIDVRDSEGRSALHRATELGNVGLIRRLVELGADVNARDDNGHTPLYIALTRSPREHLQEIVTALLDAGADANLASASGDTPLCLFVRSRRKARSGLRQLLTEHGAHLRLSDPCLGAAYLANGKGILSWLVFDPAELDARYPYTRRLHEDIYAAPALWHAARSHDEDKVKLLLAIGADPEARDTEFGRTPLQVAIDTRQPKDARAIAVALLRGGADPQAVAWDGRTTDAFDRHGLLDSIKPGELRKTRD
jgi:ankyrin repeat protein